MEGIPDLTDEDIRSLISAATTGDKTTIIKCVLSIKSLLSEVQQQLLQLMDGGNDTCDNVTSLEKTANVEKITELMRSEHSIAPHPCLEEFDNATEIKTEAVVPEFEELEANHNVRIFHEAAEANTKTVTHNTPSVVSLPQKSPSKRKSTPSRSSQYVAVKVSCEICGLQMLRQHLGRHMMKHTGLKPFKCGQCSATFSRKDKLREHQKKIHEIQIESTPFVKRLASKPKVKPVRKTNDYECPTCDFTCSTKAECKAHQKESHPAVKKTHRCEECDKEFSCPSHLEQHNIKHRTEKPFICELCGVSFSREPNLARHIRSHTDPAPFRCSYCDKPYYRQNELIVHVRKHTGEKPFVCEICGTGYTATKYLKRHLFTHTGLKPHACDICDKKFSRLENMRAHRKLHDKPKGRQSLHALDGSTSGATGSDDTVAKAYRASQNMEPVTEDAVAMYPDDNVTQFISSLK